MSEANDAPVHAFRDRIKELRRIRASELVPHPRNYRGHPQRQRDALRGVLEDVGYASALVAREGEDGRLELIDGHLRADLDPNAEVPVLVVDVTKEEADKLLATMDPITGLAQNHSDRLSDLLKTVRSENPDMKALLARIRPKTLVTTSGKDPNALPAAPPKPRTKKGETWTLGKHRIHCGDALELPAIAEATDRKPVDLLWTDPPYGMSYHSRFHGKDGRDGARYGTIENDALAGEAFEEFLLAALRAADHYMRESASLYVCTSWRAIDVFYAAISKAGKTVDACIVWDKESIGMGHGDLRPQHEFILYAKNGDAVWYGDRSTPDIWKQKRVPVGEYVHPTQKPIELIQRALHNSTKEGDAVLDPFGGSGSTLIACEMLNRRACLVEMDPEFVDVTLRRWEELTGKRAKRSKGARTRA